MHARIPGTHQLTRIDFLVLIFHTYTFEDCNQQLSSKPVRVSTVDAVLQPKRQLFVICHILRVLHCIAREHANGALSITPLATLIFMLCIADLFKQALILTSKYAYICPICNKTIFTFGAQGHLLIGSPHCFGYSVNIGVNELPRTINLSTRNQLSIQIHACNVPHPHHTLSRLDSLESGTICIPPCIAHHRVLMELYK